MAKNENLSAAKKAKNDEFYTSLETINDELYFYTTDREDLGIVNQFKGKTVFCNCDDPTWSAFWEYFVMNFHSIGLKKLISTHYDPTGAPSYKMEYTGQDKNGEPVFVETELQSNGDFRSAECIEILKEADIVVTNPPFSLFRDYMAQLIAYNKKFVIIGSHNAITYKEIFPLMKDNKVWCGYAFNKTVEFIMPDTYELKGKAFIDSEGKKHGFVSGICWFTNMDVKKHHEFLGICDYYYGNEEKYPRYENYDAINIKAIDDIPCDYEGVMGVPITIFKHLNPEQFEICGMAAGNSRATGFFYDVPYRPHKEDRGGCGVVNGKRQFARILIRNKHPRPTKGGAA